MLNIKKIKMKVTVFLFLSLIYANCQVPIGYNNYNTINYEFEENNLKGYDSIGRKQGYWEEYMFFGDFLMFYKDSTIALDEVFAQGFYVNDFKEGLWDIYDTKDYDTRKLIAHFYFEKNVMIYQFTYINNKLHQFTRIGYVHRPSNTNQYGVVLGLDELFFDDNGNIHRKSYTPDGVIEKKKY